VTEHVDVMIVGAGLSGIGAACHLRRSLPEKSFVILESRESIGGTWDLFRYPGIRSDSDMYTLGYSFRPWVGAKAIADGPAILEYVRDTAREHGVDAHVRFRHRVKRATWSSEEARWSVEVERAREGEGERDVEIVRFTAGFLYMCTGYYDYARGYTPELPGIERFRGPIVHPQQWPEDLEYAGRRVIVIGSGATAMTLVPALAKDAGHVVMLQRSPTYVVSRPAHDAIADWLRGRVPERVAYDLVRWKNVLLGMAFFKYARSRPAIVKKRLIEMVRAELGPSYDVDKHFTPRYAPWDQRLCLVPDSDLFESLRAGRASVVTDRIETLTERGIRLASGEELEADVIVTATGLSLQFLGAIEIAVDGRTIEPGKLLNYKGMMFSDVPNLACAFGYTNASWTLKADLTSEYVCRLLQHMDAIGARQCTPRLRDPSIGEEPFLDFSSGYIQRALAHFPKQGSKRPWKLYQNYVLDIVTLRYGKVDDGTMDFGAIARSTERSSSSSSSSSTSSAGPRSRTSAPPPGSAAARAARGD
jgi:monooxygenase